MEQIELYSLFISYKHGSHHNDVYVSLEHALKVVNEWIEGEADGDEEDLKSLQKEFPREKIIDAFKNGADDYFYEFDCGTWITITKIGDSWRSIQTALRTKPTDELGIRQCGTCKHNHFDNPLCSTCSHIFEDKWEAN